MTVTKIDLVQNKVHYSSMVDPLRDQTSSEGAPANPRTKPKNARRATEYATTQIRRSVLSAFGGMKEHELLNRPDICISDIKRMVDRDGQLASTYSAVVSPLNHLGFSIRQWEDPDKEPEEPEEPEPPKIDPETGMQLPAKKPKKKPRDDRGRQEALFVKRMFTQPTISGGMSQSFRQFVEEILLAIRDGFSCFEKVWRVDEDKTGSPRWVIDKFAYIPSEEVRFVINEGRSLHSVRQYRTGSRSSTKSQSNTNFIEIKADKVFLFTVNNADNAFYGKSKLLPAYYHCDKKHKLYYIMHLAYALNAIAPRIGKYPRRATEKEINSFADDLANFGTNSSMTVPEGYEITPFQQTRTLVDLMPAVTHHDQQITKSILPHLIGLGIQPTPIGDDKGFLKLFEIFLNGLMSDVADAINKHVIPELILYNFGTEYYPQINFDSVPLDRIQLAQEVFTRLIATKSVAPSADFLQGLEKILAERMGLDIDYASKPVNEFRPPEVNASPSALPGQGRPKAGTNEPISADPKERRQQDATRSKKASAKLDHPSTDTEEFIGNAVEILKACVEKLQGEVSDETED